MDDKVKRLREILSKLYKNMNMNQDKINSSSNKRLYIMIESLNYLCEKIEKSESKEES